MLLTTKTYTRPNTGVHWHNQIDMISSLPNELQLRKIEKEFDQCRHRSFEYPDDLTLVVTVIWFRKEDYDVYWSDPEIITYYQYIKNYYESNNGTVGERIIEEI